MPRRPALGAAALLLLALLAYAPALGAGWIWDDDSYVTENPAVVEPGRWADAWIPGRTPQYYPLVFLSFRLEHAAWGLAPLGYHLVNVLLHAASAILLWRLALRARIPGAGWAAAIFLLHPVHVESVAWVTERKNVLSMALALGACLAYLASDERRTARRGRAWAWWALALALQVAALLAKTVVAFVPIGIAALLLWRDGRVAWRRLLPLLPMLLVGAALGLHTAAIERGIVGAAGAAFDRSFADRLIIACRALLFYPAKLVAPWELCFVYPRWTARPDAPLGWWPLLGVAAVAALLVALWRRGRRGPLLGGLVFGAAIFPALGFANVYPHRFSFVADHFQYHASAAAILVAVGIAATLLARRPRAGAALGAAIALALGAATFARAGLFHDAETLWRATLATNPDAFLARGNLANLLVRRAADAAARGDAATAEVLRTEALFHAEAAATLAPDDPAQLGTLAELRRGAGDAEAARALQARAIALAEARHPGERIPALVPHLIGLARAERDLGHPERAEAALVRADALRPDTQEILVELLAVRLALGDDAAAQQTAEALVALRPEDASFRLTAARLARRLGDDAAARAHLGRATTLPAPPPIALQVASDLARLLAESDDPQVRDPEQAVAIAAAACRATNDEVPGLLDVLAAVQHAAGRSTEAVATAERAVARARAASLDELAARIEERAAIYRRAASEQETDPARGPSSDASALPGAAGPGAP